MKRIPKQAQNAATRAAGMAAATHGRKTAFPSAVVLRTAANEADAFDDIADGIAEWKERKRANA
jgi:hypothetical protein